MTLFLFVFSGIVTYFIREPYIYPILLLLGGAISVITSKEKNIWNKIKFSPPWKYLIGFFGFAIIGFLLSIVTDNLLVKLFESFYRYGYLVIGGGQVVVPLMYNELVEINNYMTNQEFLTGFGLVQGLPGPMFSFSAYAGAMAGREGVFLQIVSGIISGIAIFLPGVLLIFFVYPAWENIKKIRAIKISLRGIVAVSGGLIGVASIILMQKSGFGLDNIAITLGTFLLLFLKKIPAPLIVICVIVVGIISA